MFAFFFNENAKNSVLHAETQKIDMVPLNVHFTSFSLGRHFSLISVIMTMLITLNPPAFLSNPDYSVNTTFISCMQYFVKKEIP